MTKAFLWDATNLQIKELTLRKNGLSRLKQLQEAVGGFIEEIYLLIDGQEVLAFINEEARINGKGYPSTSFFRSQASGRTLVEILGNVVLMTDNRLLVETHFRGIIDLDRRLRSTKESLAQKCPNNDDDEYGYEPHFHDLDNG